ncbi:MAG: HpaII family restriction endonuclease [Candidatus Lokiarchaeota archaeon]|nr:HpaII family restriction endonuclease [Candidatus Lokiarchaeota archaeon]
MKESVGLDFIKYNFKADNINEIICLQNKADIFNENPNIIFTFIIEGLKVNEELIDEINLLPEIEQRLQKIEQLGGIIKYSDLKDEKFKSNLLMIDTNLPNLIGDILLAYFKGISENINELLEYVKENNPLNICENYLHEFYDNKTKKFLSYIIISEEQNNIVGDFNLNPNRYIVLKNDKIGILNAYNLEKFEDNLLDNAKLSSDNNLNTFGYIFMFNSLIFINLKLNIDFNL